MRLIIAFCVVGCLYAVQAKPHEFPVSSVELNFVSSVTLMEQTYEKLFSMVNTLSVDEAAALREWQTKTGCKAQKRLHSDGKSEYYLERFCIFKELINVVRDSSIPIEVILTVEEIKHLRAVLLKFLNDPTPNIKHYIEREWTN